MSSRRLLGMALFIPPAQHSQSATGGRATSSRSRPPAQHGQAGSRGAWLSPDVSMGTYRLCSGVRPRCWWPWSASPPALELLYFFSCPAVPRRPTPQMAVPSCRGFQLALWGDGAPLLPLLPCSLHFPTRPSCLEASSRQPSSAAPAVSHPATPAPGPRGQGETEAPPGGLWHVHCVPLADTGVWSTASPA